MARVETIDPFEEGHVCEDNPFQYYENTSEFEEQGMQLTVHYQCGICSTQLQVGHHG